MRVEQFCTVINSYIYHCCPTLVPNVKQIKNFHCSVSPLQTTSSMSVHGEDKCLRPGKGLRHLLGIINCIHLHLLDACRWELKRPEPI